MGVRLYGRANGHGSHAQVTAGFQVELHRAGLLEGLVALDRDEPYERVGGATARCAVFTGPLGALDAMKQAAQHERRYVMVAPNSDRIPEALAITLRMTATDVLAPSRWAAAVLTEQLIAQRKGDMPAVHVVPHGVLDGYQPDPALRTQLRASYEQGDFVVVHLSSTSRERKGTGLLLDAWDQLTRAGELSKRAHLLLILDMESYAQMQERFAARGGRPKNVEALPRAGLGAEDMSRALSTAHVVCQPSRGEGFGLVPLEARACGVPVVATACTGHSEHLIPGQPGVVIVPHGAMAPIDDLPGARAPEVTVDAVAHALRRARLGWKRLDRDAMDAAERVREDWSWQRQLAAFVEHLRSLE